MINVTALLEIAETSARFGQVRGGPVWFRGSCSAGASVRSLRFESKCSATRSPLLTLSLSHSPLSSCLSLPNRLCSCCRPSDNNPCVCLFAELRHRGQPASVFLPADSSTNDFPRLMFSSCSLHCWSRRTAGCGATRSLTVSFPPNNVCFIVFFYSCILKIATGRKMKAVGEPQSSS